MKKKQKVFVGVSGGVDSSVALALLREQGYDVTGVFLKVWHPEWLPCDWKEERRSAMRVCATLGVPFMTMDCEEEYKKEVVDYMIREYSLGRVPNPDIFCNKYVKFGVFLNKALEMGADFVATGHYARVEGISNIEYGILNKLLESRDKQKDQSYFLYTLNQEQLSKTLFPIGHLTKPEVRKLAEKFDLSTATKKDSQGLCFIGKVDMKDFLSHYIDFKPGKVLDLIGNVVGQHDGAMFYAIGQRHGFEITVKTPNDPRFFVVSKNNSENIITVANRDVEEEEKGVKEIFFNEMHFISDVELEFPLETTVRIRYRQVKQKCVLTKLKSGFKLTFDESQTGVSSGQSAVLYSGEECLGGGIIETVMP